jgi:hypothetical protein
MKPELKKVERRKNNFSQKVIFSDMAKLEGD